MYSQPLILHHWNAADILLKETVPLSTVPHLCEYMLLVDKVKEPQHIYELWNRLTGNHYHDLSEVFLHEGVQGWKIVLQGLLEEEKQCRESQSLSSQNFTSSCIFEKRYLKEGHVTLLGARFFFDKMISQIMDWNQSSSMLSLDGIKIFHLGNYLKK